MANNPRIEDFGPGVGVGINKDTSGIGSGITIDFGAFFEINKAHAGLAQKNIPRAVNYAGKRATTRWNRSVRQVVNLKASKIKEKIKEEKARRNRFQYELRVRSRGIGLVHFGARQNKAGVSYAILKGQRRTIKSTFIAPLVGKPQKENDKKGVFIRRTEKKPPLKGRYHGRYVVRGPKKGKLLERQVLQRYVGPSLAHLGNSESAREAFFDGVAVDVAREYTRLMEMDLNRIITKANARQKR